MAGLRSSSASVPPRCVEMEGHGREDGRAGAAEMAVG